MENERYLLNLYVHPYSEYRQNIQEPFRQDGRICATYEPVNRGVGHCG